MATSSGGTARRALTAQRALTGAAVACLAGSASIGVAVGARAPALDRWLHEFAVRHRGGAVLPVARTITQGGSTLLIWPMIAAAALAFPRSGDPRRWVTAAVVGAGTGAGIGVRLLSSLAVHRARPARADWAGLAGGYAYPSGHTTAATLGAGLAAWAVTRHLRSGRGRAAVWSAAVCYAGAVGWSRVWLGVHWPLDVAGGWLLGAGWLAGLAAIGARRSRRREGARPAP